MLHWHEYLEILTAIIVVVDPLGAIPIFLGMTNDQSEKERSHTARTAVIVASIVLIIACLAGQPILNFFGIRIASFQVGGGILILLLAISMVNAKVSPVRQTQEEAQEAITKQNVAVVPLAVPLLAGPAAISTIIIYAHKDNQWLWRGYLIACILLVALIVWILFRLSIPLSHKLGRTGLNNVTRIMGLVLVAIAVEFIATGIIELLPGLR